MSTEVLDEIAKEAPYSPSLQIALAWWEKKRIWYNLIVGVSGVIPIVLYANHFGFVEVFGLAMYGLILNVFYSSGFLIEALNIHYLKQKLQIEYLKYPLLIIGTLISSALTYVWGVIYFTW